MMINLAIRLSYWTMINFCHRLKTLNVEKKKKIRLDELLIERGIVENVKDAEALILSGDVFIMQVAEAFCGVFRSAKLNIL